MNAKKKQKWNYLNVEQLELTPKRDRKFKPFIANLAIFIYFFLFSM